MNKGVWRAKSAKRVVDEIEHWGTEYGVEEFHVEDLNPTIDKRRTKDICNEILVRKLEIIWKLAAGSKIETVDEETIRLMAKAGCRYISFSPETGSKELLKKMGKPFNHNLALRLAAVMGSCGIKSQACFVLGFPGETKQDIELTKSYIKKLAKAGVDEIAVFICTPIPGSGCFGKITGYSKISELTFSPRWRKDYSTLESARRNLYAAFLLAKLVYHPLNLLKQPLNIITRNFQTKMEMTVYRVLKVKWLYLFRLRH